MFGGLLSNPMRVVVSKHDQQIEWFAWQAKISHSVCAERCPDRKPGRKANGECGLDPFGHRERGDWCVQLRRAPQKTGLNFLSPIIMWLQIVKE